MTRNDNDWRKMEPISVKNLARAEVGTIEKQTVVAHGNDFDLPEAIEVGEIAGKVIMIRLEDSVNVTGEFTTELTLICDRCLDNFGTKEKFSLDLEYLFDRSSNRERGDSRAQSRIGKAESEEGLYVDKYLNIDLVGPIRDELLLVIPTKNLCKESCKGICPGCGHNLNCEACTCKPVIGH